MTRYRNSVRTVSVPRPPAGPRRIDDAAARLAAGLVYDLVWHLWRIRVIAAVLAAAVLGLRFAPQAQDALVSLGQSPFVGDWAAFAASVLWLGLNAWYWSRFRLGFRDRSAEAHGIGQTRRRWRARIRSWLPRLCGLVPFFGVAYALAAAGAGIPAEMQDMMGRTASGSRALTTAALSATLFGIGLLWLSAIRLGLRRTWHARLVRRRRSAHVGRPAPPRPRGREAKAWFAMAPAARLLFATTTLVAAAVMALYGTDPVGTGEILRPGPTILLAAAGLLCGGTVIGWYGERTGVPILALSIILAAGLAVLRDADVIADNHDIRTVPGPLPIRPDIETAFARFLAANAAAPSEPVPVILVATGGGGLAAALWTAVVLGDLADADPRFGERLFAISGVSGGSLGALAFVALRNAAARSDECDLLRACGRLALGHDFLAPALGALLYSDLLQRFIPWPVLADRATAQELAWERHWRTVTRDDSLSRPFLALWPADHPWPALFLNGTSELTGGRVVTSNLALSGVSAATSLDAVDLLRVADADVPASTAANNSARFPWFSPIGAVRSGASGGGVAPLTELVADGGYFENYGATTLLEVMEVLDGIARRRHVVVRFIVLQIVSDPDLTRAPMPGTGWSWMPRGLIGPMATLLRTRDVRGRTATETLARRTEAMGGIYVPIYLGISPTGATAPLSWALSPVARHVIDAQWTEDCRRALLADIGLTDAATARSGDFKMMLAAKPCPPSAHARR